LKIIQEKSEEKLIVWKKKYKKNFKIQQQDRNSINFDADEICCPSVEEQDGDRSKEMRNVFYR
jgi:hypothetical protein